MQERHLDRKLYFIELARTSRKFFLPEIHRHKPLEPHTKVLEIGCGEGGILHPFAQIGCSVYGVDLCEDKIDAGRAIFDQSGFAYTLIAGDIFTTALPISDFDVIILHDVIEHIDDKVGLLSKCMTYLNEGGIIYVGFPAWQMPFGGHQQAASSRWVSRLPFIHLLPSKLYRSVLEMFGEPESSIVELLHIHRTGCSIELFRRLTQRLGFRIVFEQLHFINPHYETKFDLKPRRLSPLIASIPYLRNFFSTGCTYILGRR